MDVFRRAALFLRAWRARALMRRGTGRAWPWSPGGTEIGGLLVDDSRNTDDSWVETTVVHFHRPRRERPRGGAGKGVSSLFEGASPSA